MSHGADDRGTNVRTDASGSGATDLVSECPKCGNRAFDLEPGTTIDNPQGLVRCGKCSYVCPSNEFMRPVETANKDAAS